MRNLVICNLLTTRWRNFTYQSTPVFFIQFPEKTQYNCALMKRFH